MGTLKMSKQMDRCMDEVWAVVQELPGNAREIWSQAFRKAMMEVNGDMRRAAAMAWMAFKGKEQRVGVVWDKEKAAKGRLIVAAHGETPEWIRLVGTYGLVLENEGLPGFVDRRALQAIVANWEQWDSELLVQLEDQKISDKMIPTAGWIKEIKCQADGLWIRVEWTDAGLGYIMSKEYGYLDLEFILDENNRLVELWQATLTNFPVMNQWGHAPEVHCNKMESQTKVGRTLTLIKDTNRPEVKGFEDNRQDVKQGKVGKAAETFEIRRFLQEMKELLQINGEISLSKVRQAIVELKAYQKKNPGLKGEHKTRIRHLPPEVIGKTVEEAVEKGLIKPEQRTWAEVYATRDWQGFHEFLELATRILPVKKQMRRQPVRFFQSLLKWSVGTRQGTKLKG